MVTDQCMPAAESQPQKALQPLSVGQAVLYDRKSKLHPQFLPYGYIIT